MKIIYFDKQRKPEKEKKGMQFKELNELLKKSDVVSLHCILSPETKLILNKENLQLLKQGAVLLDSGRSELVDLDAVYELCKDGKIIAWFEAIESPEIRNKFNKLSNIYLTPHFGWMTKEAQQRLREITLNNIKSYLNGNPLNVVR
jgi:glycerate dehydrogenase